MQTWQIQEAKAHFSDLVKRSQSQGPQEITLHGRAVAVVLSRETYDRLSGMGDSLVEFMGRSPLQGVESLEFERDQSETRGVEF